MQRKIFKNGKEITRNMAVQEIAQLRNWSKKRTQKEIARLNYGLRKLRKLEGERDFNKQSGLQLLYSITKSRKRYGEEYKPTESVKLLYKILPKQRKATGKKLQATGEKRQATRNIRKQTINLFKQRTQNQFDGFIKANEKAQEIVKKIKDPVKRDKALADLANKIKAKRNEQERIERESIIPISNEIVGSDTTDIDFDINDYL